MEDNELVFYDMRSGKIVTDEIYKAIAAHDTEALRNGEVGFMSKDRAQIVNGIVINRPRYESGPKIEPSIQRRNVQTQVAARRIMSESERRNYQRARSQSHPLVKQSIKRNRNNKKKVTQTIVALGMSAVLTISAYTTMEKLAERIGEKRHLNATDTAIASLLVQPNSRVTPDIVERNTHRTDDFQGYWYDNNGIAEDILKLPDEIFDAALYDVYVTMGNNRKNNYINNLDYIISGLNAHATPENNPLAFARVNGCMSFNEFLQKNGLVDDKRLPSEEKYVEFGKNAVELYYQYLKTIEEDRNNGKDNDYNYGGRL